MSINLYWMQCAGCSGDTISLLNAETPGIVEAFHLLDIEVLWHPSLSNGTAKEHANIVKNLISGETKLDIFCIEGAVARGPAGTGMYEVFMDRPKKDIVASLCKVADFVVAVGTCASFGGISADCEIEATGLQFHKRELCGFLGKDFTAKSGLPVVNLPGCPCHPDIVTGTLAAVVSGESISLNEYNSPDEWYGMLVHQGCTRNEYHEYRVEDSEFGKKGCLFFHLGCQGPLAFGSCNKHLWNNRNSKTRVGVPCFGCTNPDFPAHKSFFDTPNIEGIPEQLPAGVDRAHYMAYKTMAAEAAPERLKKRITRV